MQIQVTFRHVEPSEPVKDYANEKIGRLEKFLDGPVEANVTLTVQKHIHEADVNIVASGIKIHGRETTGDLFSALDLVSDKLERQLKRYRDKLRSYTRNPRLGDEIAYQVNVMDAQSAATEETRIIKTDRLTAKPMDADEAAMQLDLSQDDFLVFINSRTATLNVVYRRSDGNFGLIEPE